MGIDLKRTLKYRFPEIVKSGIQPWMPHWHQKMSLIVLIKKYGSSVQRIKNMFGMQEFKIEQEMIKEGQKGVVFVNR